MEVLEFPSLSHIRNNLRLAANLRGERPVDVTPLSVLLVEDNPEDIALVRHYLNCSGVESLTCFNRLRETLEYLTENQVDVVLCDIDLPDAYGLEVVDAIHKAAPEAALVILSGHDGEDIALDAMRLGAQDYLTKSHAYPFLPRAIRFAYERRAVESQLSSMAYYDRLTGLVNRNAFVEKFAQAEARAVRNGTRMALLFVDVDKFKEVNDRLGHDAGDKLLVQVGRRLQECVRPYDTVARYGGDEFVILLEDYDNLEIEPLRQRMHSVFSFPFDIGTETPISLSIGYAAYPRDGKSLSDLLKSSDQNMYMEKKRASSV